MCVIFISVRSCGDVHVYYSLGQIDNNLHMSCVFCYVVSLVPVVEATAFFSAFCCCCFLFRGRGGGIK